MMPILSNTPPWVFGLFLVLLAFGLMQTRTRTVRRVPALSLPVGMVALSLAGIQSSFGLRPAPLASWAVALALSAWAGRCLFRENPVTYDRIVQAFRVPGSWWSLGVIMAIFFAKYAYAVIQALEVDLVKAPSFVVAMAAFYGLLSGYFVARALNLVRAAGWMKVVRRP